MAAGLAQAGPAAKAAGAPARRDRPNILFLFTDQQRIDAMSAADNPSLRTPAMDAIAQGGVRFTRSFCSTPQCSPSRASIITGRYPHAVNILTNTEAIGGQPLDPRMPSVGHVLQGAGYETAWFGKWHLGKGIAAHGFDEADECGGGNGEKTAARCEGFLKRKHARPFALFASFINPHDIYDFQKIAKQIELGRRKIELPESRRDDLRAKPACQAEYRDKDQGAATRGFGDDDWRRYLDVYYYLTEKVDAEIGRVVKALGAAGLDRETIIVFTSDHGDLGGAHGMPFKGPCMYRELVNVPLAIRWPGVIREGQVNDALVSNVDLLPTLCDFAGAAAPEGVQGRSLRPLLDGRTPADWREFVVAEYYSKQKWANPIRMLCTKQWKYVRYRPWGDELYNLEKDPNEMKNLAFGSPLPEEAKTTGRQLADQLVQWMRESGDRFQSLHPTTREGGPLESEPHACLETRACA
jgi:arylsulfatase A-like enzyme